MEHTFNILTDRMHIKQSRTKLYEHAKEYASFVCLSTAIQLQLFLFMIIMGSM